jgi:hypothetical protein
VAAAHALSRLGATHRGVVNRGGGFGEGGGGG